MGQPPPLAGEVPAKPAKGTGRTRHGTVRILLVEPYFAGSHRAWAEGYARHSAHDVSLVTHDARFWKWRMQGGFVTLAEQARRVVAETGPPDVVLVSSMLHVPGFLGAARDVVGDAPVVLYMHENQLTYPPTPGTEPDLTYPMINWVSMTVADRVLFNSEYHHNVWFEAVPRLLKHFPDNTHTHLIDDVAAKSEVLPVGVDLRRLDGPRIDDDGPPLILWNHRWDYDKNPAQFFAALDALVADGIDFRVAIAGENFQNEPAEFEAARSRLGDRVVQFGFVEEAAYVDLLRRADVVVSTARQEFFGISVVEAMYAGAFPVLPNGLSYPELVPPEYHDACLYDDFDGLVALVLRAIENPSALDLTAVMAQYDWSLVAPRYDGLLSSTASSGASGSS